MGYYSPSASSTSSHGYAPRHSRPSQYGRSPNAHREPSYPSPVDHSRWTMASSPASGPTGNDRRNLYSYVSLPPQTDRSIPLAIHPLLRYTHGQNPQLRFNVSSAPVEPFHGCFSQPATNPPLPSLAIIIPHVPCPLVVHHSSSSCVTIGDVLAMIWRRLQMDDPSRWGSRQIHLLGGRNDFLGLSTSQLGEETFVLHTT